MQRHEILYMRFCIVHEVVAREAAVYELKDGLIKSFYDKLKPHLNNNFHAVVFDSE